MYDLWRKRLLAISVFAFISTGWADDRAVLAVSHPLAAQAGLEMLNEGGNAIDAAAAIQFALNVVEPQSSGIGGGAFLMVYVAREHRTYVLDARETAPAAATADQFVGRDFRQNSTSGLAVGVPGTLAGFSDALQRWGRLPLSKTLQPAIRLARKGFKVGPYLAHAVQSPRAGLWPEMRQWLRNDKGQPLQVGDVFKQSELAHTLDLIAHQGPSVFYQGELAKAIVFAQKRSLIGAAGEGRMTLADLRNYHPRWMEPLVGHYGDVTIVTMPPPSSGGVALLQALGLLERFPMGRAPGFEADGPLATHVTIEAMRMAMADRALWMGDPEATVIPLAPLLSPEILAERAQAIRLDKRMPDLAGTATPGGRNTTHFSVVDREGNVVTCTSTVEAAWGSGILVTGYGFLLNNELTDFNAVPQGGGDNPGANDVRPGMRPRSSMAPTLAFRNDHWWLAYGSPGGSTIISTVLETTLDMWKDGLQPEDALRLPRFAVLDPAGNTVYEPGLSGDTLSALEGRGQVLKEVDTPLGSVQMVGEDPVTHRRWGAADPRREGTVLYY